MLKTDPTKRPSIPWIGARNFARRLVDELEQLRVERDNLREELTRLGGLTIVQLEAKRARDCGL
jgi:hypothetical protein